MGRKKKLVVEPKVKKDPKVWRKNCGYSRWGNNGPVEPRGQLSVPMSVLKLFRKTFDEMKRRQAITAAIEWVCNNRKEVLKGVEAK